MQEIRTSGSMSGDGKRSVAAWPKLPRPSSTLPSRRFVVTSKFGRYWRHSRPERRLVQTNSVENDPGCVKTLRGIITPAIWSWLWRWA